MGQIELDKLPRPEGRDGVFVDPLVSSDARPWWSRVGGHLRNWRYIYFLLVLVLYSSPILRGPFRAHSYENSPSNGLDSESTELWTEWIDIIPSEKLKWQRCFGIYGPNLQCARLTVPMDYSRPLNESANHPKVHLALVMATGVGRTQDTSTYAEAPLLINPGGPGGSGAFFVQSRATSLQLLAGNQNDIIGFDPRGVGASTPRADCFASPDSPNGVSGDTVAYMNRITWLMSGQEVGLVNSSNVALAGLAARSRAMAKLCQRADEYEGDSSIFRHMNTPNIARDMQSMQSEATHLPSEHRTPDGGKDSKTDVQGKLVYWGFSYGTLLGATFASMFPDRVGRLVLDGVVHANHYTNLTWERSLVDADAIWDKFFVYCAEAGTLCKFYRNGDGPEDVRKRFSEILSLLEEQPATVLIPDTNLPAIVTASDVKKSVFFAGLYSPVMGFPVIADLLDHVLRDTLGEMAKGPGMVSLCSNLTLPLWPDDAMRGIACSDKRQTFNENLSELRSRYENAASYSWFADVWFGTESNIGCNGWKIETKDPP